MARPKYLSTKNDSNLKTKSIQSSGSKYARCRPQGNGKKYNQALMGHGIKWNELADAAAKEAIHKEGPEKFAAVPSYQLRKGVSKKSLNDKWRALYQSRSAGTPRTQPKIGAETP